MPKSKPDIVHSVRIELQETERATLEAALAGRFVTNAAMAGGNLLKGVGAALAPFSGALTALAAVWIADRTYEEIMEAVKVTKEAVEDYWSWVSPSKTLETYQYICAFFQASNGWDDLQTRTSELSSYLDSRNASPILKNKLTAFFKWSRKEFKTKGTWPPQSPSKAWMAFYSAQDYYGDHGLPI
mgnify:CR=1 FL=1